MSYTPLKPNTPLEYSARICTILKGIPLKLGFLIARAFDLPTIFGPRASRTPNCYYPRDSTALLFIHSTRIAAVRPAFLSISTPAEFSVFSTAPSSNGWASIQLPSSSIVSIRLRTFHLWHRPAGWRVVMAARFLLINISTDKFCRVDHYYLHKMNKVAATVLETARRYGLFRLTCKEN